MALKVCDMTKRLPNLLINVNTLLCDTRYFSSVSKIPKNVLSEFITADKQKESGVIYDKKPQKLPLVAGKKYMWCLCGKSKTQPFCDGTHRMAQFKITQKPVAFQVSESKDYWLCNCKQTNNRPFCDGTHKSPAVQEGTSIVRQ